MFSVNVQQAQFCANLPKVMAEMLHSVKSERYNCRRYHTYLDEDCIGTVKNLAKRCHRKLIELRTLMRFLLRLKFYVRH